MSGMVCTYISLDCCCVAVWLMFVCCRVCVFVAALSTLTSFLFLFFGSELWLLILLLLIRLLVLPQKMASLMHFSIYQRKSCPCFSSSLCITRLIGLRHGSLSKFFLLRLQQRTTSASLVIHVCRGVASSQYTCRHPVFFMAPSWQHVHRIRFLHGCMALSQ